MQIKVTASLLLVLGFVTGIVWLFDLVEDLSGVLTVKRQSMGDSSSRHSFHSSVGLSFAPGSQVVLRSRTTNNTSARHHFAGYWVAP